MRASSLLRALSSHSGSAPAPSAGADALRLLQSQPAHYIVAQLHARKYLLTPNDTLLVPRLSQLQVGDKIELNKILELGSRNYTLKPGQSSSSSSSEASSTAYLGPETIQARAQVVEHCKSELVRKERFKRRKRYHRIVHSKPAFTRLKILDFVIGGKHMGQSQLAQHRQFGEASS